MALRTPVDLDEIARISRAHGAKRLRVFGSALTDRFDPELSDIDLLVESRPSAPRRSTPTSP